ncbi:unnamed protein product [Schistosoma curassoni]|uniref:Ovule protein n=1 Tax=Schistosoma curassoni TaxID=6186 RepID=A0A183JR14_9TREM|nr:unnamed protein product [Schistosoma curassoni]
MVLCYVNTNYEYISPHNHFHRCLLFTKSLCGFSVWLLKLIAKVILTLEASHHLFM